MTLVENSIPHAAHGRYNAGAPRILCKMTSSHASVKHMISVFTRGVNPQNISLCIYKYSKISKKNSEIKNTFYIRDGKFVVGDKVMKPRGRGRQSESKSPEGLCKRT